MTLKSGLGQLLGKSPNLSNPPFPAYEMEISMISVLQDRWEVNLMIDISYHKSMLQMLDSDDSRTMGQDYGAGF